MTERMLKMRAAPILSTLFMRGGVTSQEKEVILTSIQIEPGHKNAISILAGKLLDNPDQPDVERLYDLLKEG